MRQWLLDECSDLTSPALTQLMLFCSCSLLVTKQMLPKLVALLKRCHVFGQESNRWYIILQHSIRDHYMTEGSCLFFGDAKEILSGELDLDMDNVEKLQGLNLR
jgi:hypothetical protein